VTLEKNDQRMLLMGLAIVIVSLTLAVMLGKPEVGDGGGGETPPVPELTVGQASYTGVGTENSDTEFTADINLTNIVNVTVTLTWNDEPDVTDIMGRHENQPDELGVTVASPEGLSQTDSASNTHAASGGAGSVAVSFGFNVTEKTAVRKVSREGQGNWVISVHVGVCGDQVPVIGPGIIRTEADTGNSFTLTVSYSYYILKERGAG